jgi:hypothetical protein
LASNEAFTPALKRSISAHCSAFHWAKSISASAFSRFIYRSVGSGGLLVDLDLCHGSGDGRIGCGLTG